MPITSERIKAECKRYIVVTSDSMSSEDDIETILRDFDLALTDLEAHLPDKDLYYHQICLEIKGIEPQSGGFLGASFGDETYDPWTSFCPSFWDKAISIPKLQETIEELLQRLRSIIEKGSKTAVGRLSEGDETQLGQPLLTHLAMRDRRYVPHFKNFLQHWDMNHEVEISGAIIEILETHGMCDEAEVLLDYCLLERGGFNMRDLLLQTFQEIDPKAAQSLLFRRFIILNYQGHLNSAAEVCRVFQARLKSRAEDAEDELRHLVYRPVLKEGSEMAAVEAEIIGQLQAIQFPQSAASTETPKKGIFGLFR